MNGWVVRRGGTFWRRYRERFEAVKITERDVMDQARLTFLAYGERAMWEYLVKWMRVVTVMVLLGFVASLALAQTPPLCGTGHPIQWDLNSEPDMKEYRLYASLSPSSIDPLTQSPAWTIVHDLSKAETLQDGTKILKTTLSPAIPDGPTYFAVTAVDDSGNESGLSNELYCNLQVSPKTPTGLAVAEFESGG